MPGQWSDRDLPKHTRRMMAYEWMNVLKNEKNLEEFSELTHQYFKLAAMRVMQFMREKYSVPPEEISTLILSIAARLLNEACYSIGGAIKNGMSINEILNKSQQINLMKIFLNEPLVQQDRDDIDVEYESSLIKFKEFIVKNAESFRI